MSILRSSILAACALGAMTFSCAATSDANKDDGQATENAASGTVDGTPHSMVGGHNMTLFGDANHLYLSHIPLYQNPHGKQVVVEVSIASGVPATGLAQFNTNNFTLVLPPSFLGALGFPAAVGDALTAQGIDHVEEESETE